MRAARMARMAAAACLLAIGFSTGAAPVFAQADENFHARLTWVPISGGERNDVAGSGAAAATLAGNRLSITGAFEGLPAPATAVRLHQGAALGARGPVLSEIQFTSGADGSISGEVELSDAQIAALRAGRLYLQVHSERGVAPDNSNLWGWFLP